MSVVDERLVRKEILRILDMSYVQGASVELVAASLLDGGYPMTEAEALEELTYLADKGYVRLTQLDSRQLGRRTVARLAPKGKDLLEGNIERDPGIL